jgi:hypothetical protein
MFKFFDILLVVFVSVAALLTFVAPYAAPISESFRWLYCGSIAMAFLCGGLHSSIKNRQQNKQRLRIMDERTQMRREEIAAGLEVSKIGFQKGELGWYDEL